MDNLIGTPPNYVVPHKYIDTEQMEYRWLIFKFTAFISQRTTTEDTTAIKFSYV